MTRFRHFRKRPLIHAHGDGARAEREAPAKGWRECFVLRAVFGEPKYDIGLVRDDGGRAPIPRHPGQPPSGPARMRGFRYAARLGFDGS
jgi:hypothetical protein